jgi:hypothetical protein
LLDDDLVEEYLAAMLALEGGGRKGAMEVALERRGGGVFARGEDRLLIWLLAIELEEFERKVCCHYCVRSSVYRARGKRKTLGVRRFEEGCWEERIEGDPRYVR